MTRAAVGLYLASLALLPWGWFPPFPWLHVHAQWSDVLLASAVVVRLLDRWRGHDLPRLRSLHVAIACYVGAAAVSFALAAAPRPAVGLPKLGGMVALASYAFLTMDLAPRPGALPWIARVVAGTTLASGAAAIGGVVLFLAGVPNPLVGSYGDLVPGAYARARAGLSHPNLLASYCIFASGVVASGRAALPSRLRRGVALVLPLTVLLTCSRGILSFACAALVRRASHVRARRLAAAATVATVAVLVTLSVTNLSLNPIRPFQARFDPDPPSRLEAMSSSWQAFLSRPLVGSGPGTSPGTRGGTPFDAHLTPLNIAASLGLPALAAFLSIPVLLWRARALPTDLALWGALLGIGLDGLAQDVEDFRHLWVLFGLIGAQTASSIASGGSRGLAVVSSPPGPQRPPTRSRRSASVLRATRCGSRLAP